MSKKTIDYIKKCRQSGFSDSQIHAQLLAHDYSERFVNKCFTSLRHDRELRFVASLAVFVMIASMLILFKPQLTGYLVKGVVHTHSETLDLTFNKSTSFEWTPENQGALNALLGSGTFAGNGTARIVLIVNDSEFVIFDSVKLTQSGLGLITGFSVVDTTDDNSGSQDAKPPVSEPEPQPDPEPTEEVIEDTPEEVVEEIVEEVIEETVQEQIEPEPIVKQEEPVIEEQVNDTVEEIIEEQVNETVEETINETVETPIVNETIINETVEEPVVNQSVEEIVNETVEEIINETIDEEPEEEEPVDEPPIVQEPVENVTVQYDNFTVFVDVCVDTCLLSGVQQDNYTIRVELENSILTLDSFKYSIIEQVEIEEVNVTINDTINETINATLENVTIVNATNETVLNITVNATVNATPLLDQAIMNSSFVEINKPVKWVQTINTSQSTTFSLPKETFNITLSSNASVKLKTYEFTVDDYNVEKEHDVLVKQLARLARQQSKKYKAKRELDINSTKARIEALQSLVIGISIDENITIQVSNATPTISLEYWTEGPIVQEVELSQHQKRITVSSDLHYTDILAYTDIIEVPAEKVNLYWLRSTGRVKVSATLVDTNNNSLVDRVEWIVPHLSNETYEVSITILTLQSYPTIGGNWITEFTTTGVANLTIEGDEGTIFGVDLEHLSLRCGETVLTPDYDGTRVYYEDYSCNETGYHTVQVLTTGKHTQKYTFGNATGWARNLAGNLPKTINIHGKLTYDNGTLVNTTVNFTFRLYDVFTGGIKEWEENQTGITVDEGVYNAILGSVEPIVLNFSKPYYLGVEVDEDGEMSPRINLTNQPYAYSSFLAEEALTVNCVNCLDETEINTSDSFDIEGTLNASSALNVGGVFNATSTTEIGGALTAKNSVQVDGVLTATNNVIVQENITIQGLTNTSGGLIIETRTDDPASPETGRIWLRID